MSVNAQTGELSPNYNSKSAGVTVTVEQSFSGTQRTTTAAVGLRRDASWKASNIMILPKGTTVTVFDTSYDGFTITTYPLGDKDCVMEVKVLDPDLATAKGISLGSTVADMTAAYGTGYRTFGYIYAYQTNDNKSLQFFVEDGVITELSYAYQVN